MQRPGGGEGFLSVPFSSPVSLGLAFLMILWPDWGGFPPTQMQIKQYNGEYSWSAFLPIVSCPDNETNFFQGRHNPDSMVKRTKGDLSKLFPVCINEILRYYKEITDSSTTVIP